ncbi:MAG: CoA-binding protein [Bacteroidia bacterium]|nr:CoA-binding protein [Bacteroidia bacterium]
MSAISPSAIHPPYITLVLGASENPARYSHIATHMLREYGHPVVAIGASEGKIGEVPIQTTIDSLDQSGIDTVTLYLGPSRQQPFEEWLLSAKPRRVIFNPGTENPALAARLISAGIQPVEACTLVMLRTQQY